MPQDVLDGHWLQDSWFVLASLPHGDELESWTLSGPELALRDYLQANQSTRLTVGNAKVALAESGANPEQIAALLVRLAEMGYLRFVGAPFGESAMAELAELSTAYHRGQRNDYFAFLGVSQQASKKVLDAAVLEASRRWHPDSLVGRHPRVQALGAQLFSLIREAAETVGDIDLRQAYIEDLEDGQIGRGGQDPQRARVLLAKARILLKGKHYAEAIESFDAAAAADPSLVIARVLAIWAAFLGNPGRVEPCIAALQDLGRQSVVPPQLWHYLGRMYLTTRDEDRARRCFSKALKIDPEYRDSQRQLRLLKKRAEDSKSPAKKGFWGRLRGR
jgi:tetratricopeptide (TPR) repeat protein